MVMGDYRMTEEHETQKKLRDFVKKNMWNIMLVMASIVASKHDQELLKTLEENK